MADPDRAAFEDALRALRNDHRNVHLPGLAAAIVTMGVLLALPRWTGVWWTPLAAAVPMGILQYRLVLSGHEAVHKTLAHPTWLNELLGIVGQALVGVNFASYRVQHLDHHRANRPEDDPDAHIYLPIARARPGLPRVARWLLGMPLEIAVKIVQKGPGSSGGAAAPDPAARRASLVCTVALLGAQGGLVLVCWALTGRITGYVEQWLLPLFLVAVMLNRTRIFVEHGWAMLSAPAGAQPGRLATVDMVVPAWEREVFAPFGFSWHASHHLHMTVPAYNLPRLAALLREQGSAGFREERGSYLTTVFRAMVA